MNTQCVLHNADRRNGSAQQGGDCRHAASQIVRKRFANNTVHLTRQCSVCGAQFGAWLKQDLYAPDVMPWFDEDLRRRWLDRDQGRLL